MGRIPIDACWFESKRLDGNEQRGSAADMADGRRSWLGGYFWPGGFALCFLLRKLGTVVSGCRLSE
jgi:hypothetical protein